jgi:iron-sulfur cluster repair protein YtfE (RIC family)
MKRDPRLHGLSSEHHHALVLAHALSQVAGADAWGPAAAAALGRRFDLEIEPHFRVEEEVLLPALRLAGEAPLVERIEADHAFLRSRLAEARGGDFEATRAFAQRLHDHVRFEERAFFPACEAALLQEVLDEVARRAPKGSLPLDPQREPA